MVMLSEAGILLALHWRVTTGFDLRLGHLVFDSTGPDWPAKFQSCSTIAIQWTDW